MILWLFAGLTRISLIPIIDMFSLYTLLLLEGSIDVPDVPAGNNHLDLVKGPALRPFKMLRGCEEEGISLLA